MFFFVFNVSCVSEWQCFSFFSLQSFTSPRYIGDNSNGLSSIYVIMINTALLTTAAR